MSEQQETDRLRDVAKWCLEGLLVNDGCSPPAEDSEYRMELVMEAIRRNREEARQLTLDECFARIVEIGGVDVHCTDNEESMSCHTDGVCVSVMKGEPNLVWIDVGTGRLPLFREKRVEVANCLLAHAAHEMKGAE